MSFLLPLSSSSSSSAQIYLNEGEETVPLELKNLAIKVDRFMEKYKSEVLAESQAVSSSLSVACREITDHISVTLKEIEAESDFVVNQATASLISQIESGYEVACRWLNISTSSEFDAETSRKTNAVSVKSFSDLFQSLWRKVNSFCVELDSEVPQSISEDLSGCLSRTPESVSPCTLANTPSETSPSLDHSTQHSLDGGFDFPFLLGREDEQQMDPFVLDSSQSAPTATPATNLLKTNVIGIVFVDRKLEKMITRLENLCKKIENNEKINWYNTKKNTNRIMGEFVKYVCPTLETSLFDTKIAQKVTKIGQMVNQIIESYRKKFAQEGKKDRPMKKFNHCLSFSLMKRLKELLPPSEFERLDEEKSQPNPLKRKNAEIYDFDPLLS